MAVSLWTRWPETVAKGDFEGGVDLGLAGLPVETSVEGSSWSKGGDWTAEAATPGSYSASPPPDGIRIPHPNVWSAAPASTVGALK